MQSPFLIARIVFFGVYGVISPIFEIAESFLSDIGLPERPRSRDHNMAPAFFE